MTIYRAPRELNNILCDFVQGIGSTGESTISVVPSGIHFSTQENYDIDSKEEEVGCQTLTQHYNLFILKP